MPCSGFYPSSSSPASSPRRSHAFLRPGDISLLGWPFVELAAGWLRMFCPRRGWFISSLRNFDNGLVNYVFYKLIVCGKLAQILTKPVTSPSKLIYLGSINQFNEAVILICDRSHSVLQVNWPPLHPSSSRFGWSRVPTDLQGGLSDKGGIRPVATQRNVGHSSYRSV